jgi:Transcriptional activator TraM
MTDPIEALIQDIAIKHGVAVGRDDPILILQTLHERLLRDAATAQHDRLDRFQEALEASAQRWDEASLNKAERTLNAALAASQEVMAKAMQEGTELTAEIVHRETEVVIAKLAAVVHDAQRVARMNLVAAGMTLFAAGLACLFR